MVVALALVCVAILAALLWGRRATEAFTPVVRLTSTAGAYTAAHRAEWEKLQAKFGGLGLEFRTVVEVAAPIKPPAKPAVAGPAQAAPASAPRPPQKPPVAAAPAYAERALVPPAAPLSGEGPRVDVLVNDAVRARYPGAVTVAGLDPWLRANALIPLAA